MGHHILDAIDMQRRLQSGLTDLLRECPKASTEELVAVVLRILPPPDYRIEIEAVYPLTEYQRQRRELPTIRVSVPGDSPLAALLSRR